MASSDGEGANAPATLVTAQELEELLARRTFWFLAGFGVLILVPVKLAWWLQGGKIVGALGALELLTLCWCSWRVWRNPKGASRFLAVGLAIMYAQVAAVGWLQGGLAAPALRWLSVLPIIAIVAGNLRLGLTLCVAFVVQILVMWAYPAAPIARLQPLVMPNPPMQILVATAGSVALFSVFGWIAMRWRSQVRQALEASHLQAQRGNEIRQRFLAVMSHEIRTPLNGIVGTASLLKHKRMAPQEQQQLLHLLDHSSQTLLGLLNDVLDWTKLEAGQVTVSHEPVRPRDLVLDSIELFAVMAFDKGLELTYSHDADLPDVLLGDPLHLRQVLNNLVSNAVKFTRQGGVHVHAAHDPFSGWLSLEVQDTGIGMTSAQVDGLFRPFAQADQSTTRQFGGTGLGLSISRELARSMGGDIVVSSRPGVGSCFVLRVPASVAPQVGEAEALCPVWMGRRLRLVTSSLGLRRQVTALAQDLGIDVLADMASPDMADATLVDAAILLSTPPASSGSPWDGAPEAQPRAVLLTAADMQGRLALPEGVRPLYKPLSLNALADWLNAAQPQAERLPAAPMPSTRPSMRVLVAEDHELNRALLGEMLDHCHTRAHMVATGRDAVAAVQSQAFDLVLLDYQMPEMDGLTATRLIRVREKAQSLPPVPIVLISGDINAETHAVWRAAGVDHILCKPYVFNDLAKLVENIRRAAPTRSLQAQAQ